MARSWERLRAQLLVVQRTIKVYIPTRKNYDKLHFLRDSITPVKTRPTLRISASFVDPRIVQDGELLVSQTTFETLKSTKQWKSRC